MTISQHSSRAAFTLVEILIGLTLALTLMTAVLSTYVFLARNFTRSLGFTSANQPSMGAQQRLTLALFAQDVQLASAISGTPSSTSVTLTVVTGSGSKSVAYYFNGTTSAVTTSLAGYSTSVPAMSLVRVDGANGSTMTLLTNVLTFNITYYDTSGSPYTVFNASTTGFSSYLGIKQLGIDFTAQGGNATNGTLTQVFPGATARFLFRNKPLLP